MGPRQQFPHAAVDAVQPDLDADPFQVHLPVGGQVAPDGHPLRGRLGGGIDAGQGDAAQDEGGDRGRQVQALGQAAGGDRAAV